MRKRIRKIAKGKFEYEKPELLISEKEIRFDVIAGKDYEGEFQITTSNDQRLRGMVYSSNSRMECLNNQFDGKEAQVRYVFHSKGLEVGETLEGYLHFVCNQCEVRVPFIVSIMPPCFDSSIGKIRNMEDFVRLARQDWDEAFKLFCNPGFANIIDQRDTRIQLVYKGLTSGRIYQQSMEEFLVAARKKKRIDLQVSEKDCTFADITTVTRKTLKLVKSGWGHSSIAVTCDQDFVSLQAQQVTDDMFMGNTCYYDFTIDPSRMHAGLNLAKLTFSMPYQKLEVVIHAQLPKNGEKREEHKTTLAIMENRIGLVELYTAYRLKRIGTGAWANETLDILEKLSELVPQEPMYRLLMAQTYIANHDREEADLLLEHFAKNYNGKKTPVWAYYLYLRSLGETEPKAMDSLIQEIKAIFREYPDSVIMFWILSSMDEEYTGNSAKKLKAIEYWAMKGCASPYLYLDAYFLIWQDPYLLTKLEDFEIRIINWAVRHKAMSREIAMQIFDILPNTRIYNRAVYEIICAAYEAYPKDEHVSLICSYLIKGQCYAPKYMRWYRKGVELGLRLTGLYEAFLLSMDETEAGNIPKIIHLYFRYDSPLPYEKLAILYRSVIRDKDTNAENYQNYRRTICKFAMEQAKKGYISDNLSVIYNDMLDLGILDQEIAGALSDIVFANKLTVTEPDIIRAVVYQWEKKDPQIVTVHQGTAYVQIYSEDYVVFLEDREGRRFESSIDYQLEPLMVWKNYLDRCIELAPDKMPYILALFRDKQVYTSFQKQDLSYIDQILQDPSISIAYKAEIWPELVHYMRKEDLDEDTEEFYCKVDYARLPQGSRQFMMNMVLEKGYYALAAELLQQYGMEQVLPSNALKLCNHMVTEMPDEDDEFVNHMCSELFEQGQYTHNTLAYLCGFYAGPADVMQRIYEASVEYEDIDVHDLEERILITVLYEELEESQVQEVFHRYYIQGSNDLILLAYITACCRRLLVDEKEMSGLIYEIIQIRHMKALELNDTCKLALLKHFTTLEELNKQQYVIADELLEDYTLRNMNFAFFKKLDQKLVYKYHLYDKMFLEYHSGPKKHVTLHYTTSSQCRDYIAEDLPETYFGVYVKQFVMFFGEIVDYYITEEDDNQIITTEHNRLMPDGLYGSHKNSRYDLLNEMLKSQILHEEDRLEEEMLRYKENDEAVRNLFRLL